MLAHVEPGLDAPVDDPGSPDDDDEDSGMYVSEELAALNDCDVSTWCWCMCCEACVDVGAAGRRKALLADEWWERDDREEAWAEVLRKREVDRVAAEHAARQCSLFEREGGGS